MRDVDLFQLALNIRRPSYVERTEFDPERKRLDIHIDFEPGRTFACPECGRSGTAKTLTKDRDGLLRWFHFRINNGVLEGIWSTRSIV